MKATLTSKFHMNKKFVKCESDLSKGQKASSCMYRMGKYIRYIFRKRKSII